MQASVIVESHPAQHRVGGACAARTGLRRGGQCGGADPAHAAGVHGGGSQLSAGGRSAEGEAAWRGRVGPDHMQNYTKTVGFRI